MLETLSRETLTVPQVRVLSGLPETSHRVLVQGSRAPQPALRRSPGVRSAAPATRSAAVVEPVSERASVPARPVVQDPSFRPVVLRITRRGRLVLLATVVVLLFLAFSIGRVMSNAAPSAPATATTHTVVVAPGDTAWSIARAAMPGLDGRDAVDRLLALNHSDGRLQVGQTLVVPGS